MQINRLFEIIYILINKRKITAKELAEHFEVSARTILRDIENLSEAGIPIYTSQGKGGGISILDNFVLNKTLISEEEQNEIIFALQSLTATENIDTENTLGKLRSLFEKSDINWIEVDFSRWGNSSGDKIKFDNLKKAIINKNAVSFEYSSSYGETRERKVCPLKLLFKSKSWYLQAFCLLKENYRIFKINRILNLKALDESFADRNFEIPNFENNSEPSPALISVKLRFSPHLAYRVYDEFDEKNITKCDDGSLIVNTKLPNDYWLYEYILSFGAFIEVLEPKAIRDGILEQLEKIKFIYSDKT